LAAKTTPQDSNCRYEKSWKPPIRIAHAHRDDGKRFIVHSDKKLSALVELERQVLTVTFYLESIHRDPHQGDRARDVNCLARDTEAVARGSWGYKMRFLILSRI
jgi:hypothetical protein